MTETLQGLIAETERLTAAATEGRFQERGDDSSFEGSFAHIIRGINGTLDVVVDKVYWYEALLDNVPLQLSVTDLERNLTFINRPMEERLGTTRADALGQPCSLWNKDICGTDRCGIECLLPDAYYVSNREADRRVRPLSLRAAVNWLEGTVSLPAEQLRAVVAGCGETRVDEYRIGFTPAHSNDVYYGCVWPLYGREDEEALDDGQPGAVEEIAALLREFGVGEVRRIPGMLPPEFCEDCGAPYFPNPQGELVHAELPEDASNAPAHFH